MIEIDPMCIDCGAKKTCYWVAFRHCVHDGSEERPKDYFDKHTQILTSPDKTIIQYFVKTPDDYVITKGEGEVMTNMSGKVVKRVRNVKGNLNHDK